MKTVIFLAAIAYVTAAVPDYYDLVKLDMPKLSKDPKEFKIFVDCILDKGPCSPLYKTYRAIVQDTFDHKCKRCSDYQRHCYWQFLQGLKALFPQDYISFKAKYDPENKYFNDLESLLNNYAN
ncbi:allergen Tha p 1-like [Danaus plexippus]|uniref:allergen Tha p 1-like n=1 Tax=Danaus plexippus TaxID=13037 RepID=UPI002AB2490C|nr:allergen Tha p 1-like [Danaus plexippus]